MHALLDDYVEQVWRQADLRNDEDTRLALIVLKKRGLSSAMSLATSLRRRIEHLPHRSRPAEAQLPLPLADEFDREDEEPVELLTAVGLDDPGEELRQARTCG